MPDYNAILQQQIEQAKRQMQQEMPGQMAGTSVEPAGLFGRALGGLKAAISGGAQVEAMTNPFTGNISYNPKALLYQNQEYINDLLAHELTHTGQVQQRPWYSRAVGALTRIGKPYSYSQDPDELEAFQAASDRATRVGREAPQQPSFYDTSVPQVGNIQLPKDKR